MTENGVTPGDRVALFMGNNINHVANWFGAAMCGAIPASVNSFMRDTALAHVIGRISPKVIVCEPEYLTVFASATKHSNYEGVLATSGSTSDLEGVKGAVVPLEGWLDGSVDFEPYASEPWEPGGILLTSGTTGPSKGILCPHNMLISCAESFSAIMDYQEDDIIHGPSPMFYGNTWLNGVLGSLVAGAHTVFVERFSASNYWREIQDWKVTKGSLVGIMAPVLLQQAPCEEELDNTLKRVIIVPSATSYHAEFRSRFQVEISTLMGTTDMGAWAAVLPSMTDAPPDSVGQVMPEWEVELHNENDEPVAIGEVGEAVLRPKKPYIGSLGYINDAAATMKSWRNLWFHTNDLLRQDSDGWFYFVDRVGDKIRRSGQNISAFEVEQVMLTHPDVVEVAVFGVPGEFADDDVMATLVLRDSSANLEKVAIYVEERIAYYAVPRYWDTCAELPKSATMKVQKTALKSAGITKTTWDRGSVKFKSLVHD